MAVYFRYTEDKKIKIAKTKRNSGISEKEFEERAIEISYDEFMTLFRKKDNYSEIRVNVSGALAAIERFKERKLSKIGPVLDNTIFPSYRVIGCYIGDKYFSGDYNYENVKKTASEYGEKYYGKEFMEKVLEMKYLDAPQNEIMIEQFKNTIPTAQSYVHFFVDGKEISYEAYSIIENRFKEILNIRSLENPCFEAKKIFLPNGRKR